MRWFVLAALAACTDSAKPAPPAASSAPAVSAAPTPPAAGASLALPPAKAGLVDTAVADGLLANGKPALVRLLDPGKEPRQPLRYAFTVGQKQAVELRMTIEMDLKGQPKQPLPDLVFSLELTAASKPSATETTIEGVIRKVHVQAKSDAEKAMVPGFENNLRGVVGMGFSYVCSAEGRLHDVALRGNQPNGAAAQMLEQLKQSFDSMVAPLPTEPIGVGARWQTLSRLRTVAEVLQLTTFTLRDRSDRTGTSKSADEVFTLDTDIKQLAASPAIVMGGITGTLKEWQSTGSGNLQIALNRLAPTQAQGSLRTHMIETMPGVDTMTVDTVMDLHVRAP